MIPYYKPYITSCEIKAVNRVLRSGNLAQGIEVGLFENEYSEHCGDDYCIAVSSATAGLYLICKYMKLFHDWEEINIPAYTFCATYQAAKAAGLNINIRDVNNNYVMQEQNDSSWSCDVLFAGTFENHKTNYLAFLPIFDAAHCFPFKGNVTRVYSFYATKPITCGEGGMIVTKDKQLADWCRKIRQHGRKRAIGYNENPAEIGFNFKMTEIQAAIGREQLKKIKYLKDYRIGIVNRYLESLKDMDIYYGDHLFMMRFENYKQRIKCENLFNENQIGFSRPYIPLVNIKQAPNAWNLYERSISIPYYVGLKKRQQNIIIDFIKEAAK